MRDEHTKMSAVQPSTTVELIVNLKTAKTLGFTIPLVLLGRADEVGAMSVHGTSRRFVAMQNLVATGT